MRRVGSVQRGLRFIRKGKLTLLNAQVGAGGAHTLALPAMPCPNPSLRGWAKSTQQRQVLESWGSGLEMTQRSCSHPLHPNKSLLHNPCSYTDTEGARDYSTQITRQLLLLSPSLQGLHKPRSSGSAPSRAAFSPYARKASVHGGKASLTQKRQTAINTFLLGATHAVWHFCALFK